MEDMVASVYPAVKTDLKIGQMAIYTEAVDGLYRRKLERWWFGQTLQLPHP